MPSDYDAHRRYSPEHNISKSGLCGAEIHVVVLQKQPSQGSNLHENIRKGVSSTSLARQLMETFFQNLTNCILQLITRHMSRQRSYLHLVSINSLFPVHFIIAKFHI